MPTLDEWIACKTTDGRDLPFEMCEKYRKVKRGEKVTVASVGVGDTIEKVAKSLGLNKLVRRLYGGCKCSARRAYLNKMFPYNASTWGDRISGLIPWKKKPVAAPPVAQPPAGPYRQSKTAVIVISHNYGRFLGEALESVYAQTSAPAEVVLIDDASDDNTWMFADAYKNKGLRYIRVENRSVFKNRMRGLAETNAPYVIFLDADDALPPQYIEEAEKILDSAEEVGLVYSDFLLFGDENGPVSLNPLEIEQLNFIHCEAVARRTAIQSVYMESGLIPGHAHEDWWLWREVLRTGWAYAKNPVPVRYRKHSDSMLATHPRNYRNETNFDLETVQVVIPISGRERHLDRLMKWFENQTHPRVSLLIADSSGKLHVEKKLRTWMSELTCNTQYIKLEGTDGLSDKQRWGRIDTIRQVQVTMSRIYNKIVQHLSGEWIFWLEDDVDPPLDAIHSLSQHISHNVAAVSGVLRSRYDAYPFIAWNDDKKMLSHSGVSVQDVTGTGFGCLLVRRSVLNLTPFHCGGETGNYDQEFAAYVKKRGFRWLIDWSVKCLHEDLHPDGPLPAPNHGQADRLFS